MSTLQDRVKELLFEQPDSHWWMVTAYGWAFEADPDWNAALHNKSFATKREALAARRWLEPCRCRRCTSKGRNA